MSKININIRPIQIEDNSQIAKVIRSVFIDMGIPKVGTAYEDKSLDVMFESYYKPKHKYFVVEQNNEIFGGAGIAPLDNYEGNICELQKMYFSPRVRGLGLGKEMIDVCLDFAKQSGFDQCYLETMPFMTAAQNLYKKVGFQPISKSMGDTGHYSCSVWMIKDL